MLLKEFRQKENTVLFALQSYNVKDQLTGLSIVLIIIVGLKIKPLSTKD
jgi:hypothetical protein